MPRVFCVSGTLLLLLSVQVLQYTDTTVVVLLLYVSDMWCDLTHHPSMMDGSHHRSVRLAPRYQRRRAVPWLAWCQDG